MDLIVVGGGCYGCFHTRQLLKALRRGRIAAEHIHVVDRNPGCQAISEFASEPRVQVSRADWATFLSEYLRSLPPDTEDMVVPAPFAPHLLCDWLADAVAERLSGWKIERQTCELELGLPFERVHDTGNRYISAASWVCPVTCIEPTSCPAIHGERTWELGDIVRSASARSGEPFLSVVLFTCRHFAFGVGAIPVRGLLDARRAVLDAAQQIIRERAASGRVLVGTVSACHGVLGQLALHAPSRSVATTGR